MLPKPPPRRGQLGFLYLPPYRVQGISVAGEQTTVQIPELDVAFDVGMCPRPILASNYIALSHGHMDHVGGLPYYFSQRMFQRIGVGTCLCHPDLAGDLEAMMQGWQAVEHQQTPHHIIPLPPGQQFEVKNNVLLRAIEVSHTVPALGFALIERRSKLKEEFRDLPQSRLRELKGEGVEITRVLEIPLIAYSGDTEFGPFLFSDEFAKAQIVIAECTFYEPDHRKRSRIGKHLHVDDLAKLMDVWEAEHVVIVHASRRSHLSKNREHLAEVLGPERMERVHFLMDHQTNRRRYEGQLQEAEAATAAG